MIPYSRINEVFERIPPKDCSARVFPNIINFCVFSIFALSPHGFSFFFLHLFQVGNSPVFWRFHTVLLQLRELLDQRISFLFRNFSITAPSTPGFSLLFLHLVSGWELSLLVTISDFIQLWCSSMSRSINRFPFRFAFFLELLCHPPGFCSLFLHLFPGWKLTRLLAISYSWRCNSVNRSINGFMFFRDLSITDPSPPGFSAFFLHLFSGWETHPSFGDFI